MTKEDLQRFPDLSPGYRMQWEEVQSCHVLLYPEGMVQLNESASVILAQCDGQHSLAGIIENLEREYGEANLRDDVLELMGVALERGWVKLG